MFNPISVSEVRERYSQGESCYDVISEFLEKIKDSRLNTFISISENEALAMAEKIDKGKLSGRLKGIPVSIKDAISTRGIRTTCGSKILENYVPPFDAHVIERIKAEGGIIIGKTNMDEFCMGTTTETSYFGPSKNPWDESRVPGGSSGGSAASIAEGSSVLSLGSDTGGSVRCPAAFCGVVGIKPTYGLVSRYGLIPYANSLEQIGPIASNVKDAALLLEIIAGKDYRDSTSVEKTFEFKLMDVSKVRIGIIREMIEKVDEKVQKETWRAINKLEELGMNYEEVSLPMMDYTLAAYYILAMSEASSNLSRYDGVRYGYHIEKEMNWNTYFSKVRAEGFGDEVKRRILLGTYALSAGYYGKYYLKALRVRNLIIQAFNKLFERYDVLLAPTMPTLPFRIGEIQDPLSMYLMDINTVPVNLAGLPAVSVPAGLNNGLPVGLQIIGKPFDENMILNVALKVEEEVWKR